MRTIGFAVFGVLVLVMTALFTLGVYGTVTDKDEDSPEVATKKAECRQLIKHVIELSPETKGKSPDELVAAVPVEDIDQCSAARPGSVLCMVGAATLADVHNCIPKGIDCEGPKTEVPAGRPVYQIGGDCKAVTVTASKTFVYAGVLESLEVTGNDNVIEWTGADGKPDPKIDDHGTGNKISKAKKKD